MAGLMLFLTTETRSKIPIDLPIEATVADLLEAAEEPSYHRKWLNIIIKGAVSNDLQPETMLADIGIGQEQEISIQLDKERLINYINVKIDWYNHIDNIYARLHITEEGEICAKFSHGGLDTKDKFGWVLIREKMFDEFKILVDCGVINLKRELGDYDHSYFDDADDVPKEFLLYLLQNEASRKKYCSIYQSFSRSTGCRDKLYERIEKFAILLRAGMRFVITWFDSEPDIIKRLILDHTDITSEEYDSAVDSM